MSVTDPGWGLVQAKTMKDKVGDLVELLQEILLTGRLDNQQRFKQMVLETKAGLESGRSCAVVLTCTGL